jgi:hypothetical protein
MVLNEPKNSETWARKFYKEQIAILQTKKANELIGGYCYSDATWSRSRKLSAEIGTRNCIFTTTRKGWAILRFYRLTGLRKRRTARFSEQPCQRIWVEPPSTAHLLCAMAKPHIILLG